MKVIVYGLEAILAIHYRIFRDPRIVADHVVICVVSKKLVESIMQVRRDSVNRRTRRFLIAW